LTPAVLKTVRPERVSWVRIPPPPPASLGISLCPVIVVETEILRPNSRDLTESIFSFSAPNTQMAYIRCDTGTPVRSLQNWTLAVSQRQRSKRHFDYRATETSTEKHNIRVVPIATYSRKKFVWISLFVVHPHPTLLDSKTRGRMAIISVFILIASPGFFVSQSMNQRFGRYRASSSGSTRSNGSIPSRLRHRWVRKEPNWFLSVSLGYGCARPLPAFDGGLCFDRP
jgi:hypothetical protein